MDDGDRFIEEYRGLVQSIANKVRAELDLKGDLDDLVAYGMRGLVEARSRYDESRGVQFNTFAYYRIRGAMLDGIRKMSWLPRRAHARLRATAAADDVAEQLSGARADDPASRQDLGRTVETLDQALGRVTAAFTLAAVGQEPEPDHGSPEREIVGAESRSRVRSALAILPERERALVEGFYFEGRRFDEVARELGISKSWASRLHSKALDLLRSHLEDP